MSYFGRNQRGTYRPTRETYPLMETLAIAVAVDREQGFIKSQRGYWDEQKEAYVNDNRNATLTTLRIAANKQPARESDGTPIRVFTPTDEDRKRAEEIYNLFDQKLLFEKMSDNLVKIGKDGSVNRFDEDMLRIFESQQVDVNRDMAMIVSLPNSQRIAARRDEMDDFYSEYGRRGFIGEMKQRMKIAGEVKDVKFIPRHKLHLVTVLTDGEQIAKFFVNDGRYDPDQVAVGKAISFLGTVKKQAINEFSDTQETLFNRVKVD